jgi:outer membrane lipoprotein-sorting protein
MRRRFFLLIIILVSSTGGMASASTPAEDLFAKMEHHLRGISSLEVTYKAEGEAFPEGGQSGRMVWTRPDGFFHDTPEWMLAQRGTERWRYLKEQQTLILEDVREDDPLLPEQVLFTLRQDVKPEALETDPSEGNASKLTLRMTVEDEVGSIWLWLRKDSVTPFRLAWAGTEGTIITYRIDTWNENVPVEESLFQTPKAEHVINFRLSKDSGGLK